MTFDDLTRDTSPAFLEITNAARLVAATDVTTLICGESGTGKELIARAMHAQSPRSEASFLSINCASLTEQLADSLLFGYRKGAFTGADRDHCGYIRAATGGTLFLDEIGEFPIGAQAKLLRFLECGECLPLGEVQPVFVDVRIIAATNRNLSNEAETGRFRQDLLYRLNIVPLVLPPLRERREEIPTLLQRFVDEAAETHRLRPPTFSQPSLKLLRQHAWPGNVRELRNLAIRMTILFPGQRIEPTNLPLEMRMPMQMQMQMPSLERTDSQQGLRLPKEGLVMHQLEVDLIRQALARTGGNRSHAANLLGITRDTLLYRLKKYAIG
ncbi:sigma-54 dependent transcriptional regulator [Lamprobacter modestohalophilus]|nr:sigma-54 dependent transcriptional regulator [Lamprobacter modestohalophilus]MEA1051726.1 sigma-54 dependent transcriptional regulator [Lamprobacter modestohalophilus]